MGGHFDAAKKLTAVGQIANTPIAIAVRADAPCSSYARRGQLVREKNIRAD